MVACHGKLRVLSLDGEIRQILLLWKLIAKAHAVVIYTETEIHETSVRRLFQFYKQLVVMVADAFLLTPHWLPCFIK